MNYIPIGFPFFMLLWFLFAILVVLVEIGLLEYVFESMGIGRRYMFFLLICCLFGSYINIPVAQLPPEQVASGRIVDFFGIRYIVPYVEHWPGTVIAVNLGGAVIPFLLSIYLIIRNGLYTESLAAVTLVTIAVHVMAKPVRGVGVVVPIFIPPLITAVVAVVISRRYAAPLAYIAGSLGTLLGADILNLGRIRGMGAPVASIGGAGKFDGIFLTGMVAVLIAGVLGARRPRVS
jgi:uncharacterized membrane protein